MTIGSETSALGALASDGAPPPKSLGEQVEYLFAKQLVQAMASSGTTDEKEEGGGYLSLLGEPLTTELVRSDGLGIARQLALETKS